MSKLNVFSKRCLPAKAVVTRFSAGRRFVSSRDVAADLGVQHTLFLVNLQNWAGCLPASLRDSVCFECGDAAAWICEEVLCL